jgi:hypothetical protein
VSTPKTNGLIELRNGRSNDRPSLSQQFQIQRNRHSCTKSKMAVSRSFGSRPKLSGTSKSTLISLRAVSPAAHRRSAEASPVSSRSGAPHRGQIHRESRQGLPNAVVQFASESASLLLLKMRFTSGLRDVPSTSHRPTGSTKKLIIILTPKLSPFESTTVEP